MISKNTKNTIKTPLENDYFLYKSEDDLPILAVLTITNKPPSDPDFPEVP